MSAEHRLFKSAQTACCGQPKIVGKESSVTARAGVWKRKREDLMNKRIAFFKSYKRSPYDLRLAREIRIIDDEIAECTQQIEQESGKPEFVQRIYLSQE